MPNAPIPDLDALIADAERAVIDADARFVQATGTLSSAVRGRAGRTIKQAAKMCAVGAVAVLGTWLVFASKTRRRRKANDLAAARQRVASKRPLFAPPAPALPPRSKAAGFLGDTIGSALRSGTAPRSAGWVSMLAMPVVSMLMRRARSRRP